MSELTGVGNAKNNRSAHVFIQAGGNGVTPDHYYCFTCKVLWNASDAGLKFRDHLKNTHGFTDLG